MAVGETIRALVLTESDITDLIGTRMYFLALPPEATTPAIVYREISGRTNSEDASNADTYTVYRIQFDIYDDDPDNVKTLRDALITLLNRYSGTVNSQYIVDITFDLMFDLYYPEPQQYRQVMDAKIHVKGS